MTTPLSEFRDIVHLLFRVVHPDAYHTSDLHSLIDKLHDTLIRDGPPYLPPFDFMLPYTHEPPTLVIHPDQEVGEVVPNVIVTKEETDSTSNTSASVRNVVVNLQTPLVHAVKVESSTDKAILQDLAKDNDSVSSAEIEETEEEDTAPSVASESVGEEMEAEEMSEEEEEDEDEDLELLKIKKVKYYYSPSSTRIYECLEEGYGDCLGKYVDGKIIPK